MHQHSRAFICGCCAWPSRGGGAPVLAGVRRCDDEHSERSSRETRQKQLKVVNRFKDAHFHMYGLKLNWPRGGGARRSAFYSFLDFSFRRRIIVSGC